MSRTLRNINLGLEESLAEHLAWLAPDYGEYRVLRQSIDARKNHSPRFVYTVEVFERGEAADKPLIQLEQVSPSSFKDRPVVIVGAGPAGLFAALRLSERGIPCILLEQGSATAERIKAIGRFWRYGNLNPHNNVGFGEGGAGLFSDGKLITRIKSPHIPYVMQRLVQFGANPEIEYMSNPHVGSDRIRRVIPKLRERLLALGCKIHFDTKVSEILTLGNAVVGVKIKPTVEDGNSPGGGESVVPCDRLILACGHSAEDMFQELQRIGVYMQGKSFAVGLRVEHPQSWINQIQFREHADHPKLGAAAYRLASHDAKTGIGVYSFCMCPGGYVLSCSTDGRGVVSNGMSNYRRNSPFANAALVVSVDFEKSFGGEDRFAGLRFRNRLEAQALEQVRTAGGSKELPAQRLVDFRQECAGPILASPCPSGVVPARLDQLFDVDFKRRLNAAFDDFEGRMKGFVSETALLHGVETRTSCPIRIVRDPITFHSLSHCGLYPTGEGAGYAGGITSAACDGIRVAEAIVSEVTQRPSAPPGPTQLEGEGQNPIEEK